MKKIKKAKERVSTPDYPKVIETFYPPRLSDMTQDSPSCFNGMIRIKKYRVTIEEIEESDEVMAQRLQDLWEHSRSWHDGADIQKEAKKRGVELVGERGKKV